ncbi:MAG: hypothetical protein ACJ73D_04205 [Pyrinomonadaceae bacterium]
MKYTIGTAILLVLSTALFSQTPQALEQDMATYLAGMVKYGSYGGSFDDAQRSKNEAMLREAIEKNGTRRDVLDYEFPKLQDKMYIVTSPDHHFRIYSWDSEDGGTMHDFQYVVQYRGKSGSVAIWNPVFGADDSGGGFYTDVFQTDGPEGPIYLAVSTYIGSTSLNGQTIQAFSVRGDKFVDRALLIKTAKGPTNSISFAYDFFSVVDHPERPVKLVIWNAADKSFKFPVVIEDAKTPQGRVTNKFITYRFDGKYFVKVT